MSDLTLGGGGAPLRTAVWFDLNNSFQCKDLRLIMSSSPIPRKTGRSLTFEQHPPNMSAIMPPTASHCGMVSINIRPAIAMIFEKAERGSSMPYISAFSREGAALMILGFMTWPSEEAEAWRSLSVERRRGPPVMGPELLPESVLRFLAIQVASAHCLRALPGGNCV